MAEKVLVLGINIEFLYTNQKRHFDVTLTVLNMSYNEWTKDTRFNPNVEPTRVPILMP